MRQRLTGQAHARGLLGGGEKGFLVSRQRAEAALHQAHTALSADAHAAAGRQQLNARFLGGAQQVAAGGDLDAAA